MAIILPIPSISANTFAFPGRSPGFDPRHIAAQGMSPRFGLSAVCNNNGFTNLLTGAGSVLSGTTLTNKMTGAVGPTSGNTNGTGVYSFAGQATSRNPASRTYACIMLTSGSVSGTQVLIATDAANNDLLLIFSSKWALDVNSTLVTTTNIAVSPNTPYFIAASCMTNSLNVAFIAVNLATGSIKTQLTGVATGTFTAPASTVLIANDTAGTAPANGFIAAAMWSPVGLNLGHLLAWAADPWAFWYPRQPTSIIVVKTPPAVAGPSSFIMHPFL